MTLSLFERFLALTREIWRWEGMTDLLAFDQDTVMPPKGSAGRGEHFGLVAREQHACVLKLAEMMPDVLALEGLGTREAAIVREMNLIVARETALTSELVQAIAKAESACHAAWVDAKKQSRFDLFAPTFSEVLALKREAGAAIAAKLGGGMTPYEALMDKFEPGMRVAILDPLFAELRSFLVALLAQIKGSSHQSDTSILKGDINPDVLLAFCKEIATAIGFDFKAGLLTLGNHPMTARPAPGDVRLSTRIHPNDIYAAFFGALHEGGHGKYEQAFGNEWGDTPAEQACSLGIHESQSRLWEKVIGHSMAFWSHFLPQLAARFPHFQGVPLGEFWRAINAVRPLEPLRVEADEVMYNLHIILRYKIERALLEGSLAVNDLPTAWNDLSEILLGFRPENAAKGVLQDVHLSQGNFGYFPTYTLGNITAAQFFAAMQRENPGVNDEIAQGDFRFVNAWLAENVWQHGRMFSAGELIVRATGKPLGTEDYKAYLGGKMAAVYQL